MKLNDNDFDIMNIIWDEREVPAIEITIRLADKKGRKKANWANCLYYIDRLIKKVRSNAVNQIMFAERLSIRRT